MVGPPVELHNAVAADEVMSQRESGIHTAEFTTFAVQHS